MKKGKNKIKAIIFDIGGVLYLPKFPLSPIQNPYLTGFPYFCNYKRKGIHEYLADKFKVSLDQWFDSIDTAYVKSIEGQFSEKKVVNIVSKNLHVQSKKLIKFVKKAYKRNFTLNKPLFKKARELKSKGYKIAILSDQWHLSARVFITNDFYKFFNPIILSCYVGFRKPNPEIYKLILEKLKLKPSETLFIDNQKWNINPAKRLGMRTILFKSNKQLFRDKSWEGLFKK